MFRFTLDMESSESRYITYWYPFLDISPDQIIRKGLLPANLIRDEDRMSEYGERWDDADDADDYFERIYEKRYQPVLKRPYPHFGIYTTPLDLFFLDEFPWRIVIQCAPHEEDMVFQVGADVEMLTPEVYKKTRSFSKKYIREKWSSSKLKFKRLPQIVYFGDVPLTVSKEQIEYA